MNAMDVVESYLKATPNFLDEAREVLPRVQCRDAATRGIVNRLGSLLGDLSRAQPSASDQAIAKAHIQLDALIEAHRGVVARVKANGTDELREEMDVIELMSRHLLALAYDAARATAAKFTP